MNVSLLLSHLVLNYQLSWPLVVVWYIHLIFRSHSCFSISVYGVYTFILSSISNGRLLKRISVCCFSYKFHPPLINPLLCVQGCNQSYGTLIPSCHTVEPNHSFESHSWKKGIKQTAKSKSMLLGLWFILNLLLE